MKNLLRAEDICCLCSNLAKKTTNVNLEFGGMVFPVVAALCNRCYALPNRDHLLRRYVDGIFGTDAENRVTG